MPGDFGPESECSHCHRNVQTYNGPRVDYQITLNAGTWEGHSCPERWAWLNAIPETLACHCGRTVLVAHGVKYERDGETVHDCAPTAHWWSPPKTEPVKPIKAQMPKAIASSVRGIDL